MPASAINLREVQAPLKERYLRDPAAALITCRARSVGSELSDPLHCEIEMEGGKGNRLRSGAHAGVGGAGDVPCSGDLLLAALIACQETTIRMVAAAMGIELEEISIEATATADLRGTLAISREVPVGISGIDCRVRLKVRDDGRGERAQRLLESAEKYCIVLSTLRSGVDVRTDFEVARV